jgi:dihydroxy-acid dehydratase
MRAPESAVGGPLAIVQTGDRIMLDVEARRIDLLIDNEELQRRLVAWKQLPPQSNIATRGYARLFEDSVLQADQGCDFNFLLGESNTRTRS